MLAYQTIKNIYPFYMNTKTFFLLCCYLLLQSCGAQTSSPKEIHIKEFNWTITLPNNFETVSAEEWTKMQNKGADAIEKTYDEKIENRAKTLFVFRSDQLNYFESNYQLFDTATDGSHKEAFQAVNEMLYETFMAQIEGVKIDTVVSTTMIDKLEFETLQMKITYPNNMVLYLHMFSRLFGNKEFTVNIMYADKVKGALMLDAWRKSVFGAKEK